MKKYLINYLATAGAKEQQIEVMASNSAEAYIKVAYEILKSEPYALYVEAYITKDGKKHIFSRNMYGKGY